MFHASASDISLMVAASAISATLTTIFIGALSDKIGKRKIFICGGYMLWGISIWSFSLIRTDIIEKAIPLTVSAASIGVSIVIIMDCVMTFFGSAANDACFNAWLTDVTDDTNRGAAEGINSMMPLVAILVVFGGFMGFNLDLVFRPFIKVEGLTSKEFRQQKVSILDYTAVVFTSRHAIDHFFTLCTELRVTITEPMKYFCTSEQIALYIQNYVQYRKRKVFFGATGKFNDLIPSIVKHNTEKYFVPMSDVHTDEIKNALDAKKIQHTEAVMYRTVSNEFTPEEKFDYDMLLFFSPAGIQSLLKNFPEFDQKDIAIGCFGPATAKAVKDAGLRLDLEAPTVEAPSMTAALDKFIAENNKE